MNDWPGPFPSRLSWPEFSEGLNKLHRLQVVSIFLTGLWLLSHILRIVNTPVPLRNASKIEAASIFFWLLDLTWIFAIFSPPPLAQVLFIVAKQRKGGVSKSGICYVIFSLCGGFYCGTVRDILLKRVMWGVAFRIWMETFKEDWPMPGTFMHRLYFKYLKGD